MATEWTPDRLQILKTLRGQGVTFNEIARSLGCTTNAAVSAWHRKVYEGHPTFSRLRKSEKERKVEEINTWMVARIEASIPTLAFINGLGQNPRYRMKQVSVV